jgi:hypothetical protein
MIVITKKALCLILVGLSTLAVASLCSILRLEMHQAILAFLVTWVGVIALVESADFNNHDLPHDHGQH